MALTTRRIAGSLSSLLVALVATVGLAGAAHAEDGFRYWHYFHLEGDAWAFAETGPADFVPEDGAVEGFRFGTSTMAQPIEPRVDLGEVDFDTVCADTEAADGEKRVAVLLDYGSDEGVGTPPEPRAACAAVAEDASTQQVLDEVSEVRLDKQMSCAIDGYPATGCGDPVQNAEVPTDEKPVAFALSSDGADDDEDMADAAGDAAAGGLPWPLIALVALAVLIAAAGLLLARRRRNA